MNLKSLLIVFSLLTPIFVAAQLSAPPDDWFLLDKLKDGYMGVSAEKAYQELLKGKKSQSVIVAVIDGGVDPMHEDLKDVMWENPGEIPGNNKDDDGNGYVDDVYGWNFIGGKDGKNVQYDQLELTRIYSNLRKQFKNADPSKLSKKDKKLYDEHKEMEQTITEKREEAASNAEFYGNVLSSLKGVVKAIGKENITEEDLENFDSPDKSLVRSAQIFKSLLAQGGTPKEIIDNVQDFVEDQEGKAKYNYNPDLEVRQIVGDNYLNSYERYYGNNDVLGIANSQGAMHGTHVAGIVAAKRGNNTGMDGVADNVKIMAVRVVPDGDERDKDVANAIIYAVDNGATVVNMSFGKGYAWDKTAVDKAVKYAMKKDVLLIHAAGNDAQNMDEEKNFPNDKFEKRGLFGPKEAKNWIEVGALSWQDGEDMVASFSDFGKKNVDLFAPGKDIYATVPGNEYKHQDGTSMAAPVVAGVAAVIRSYYPNLTAEQVKDVMMSSTVMTKNAKVKVPGEDTLVPFSDLCVTGGVVNTFEAVKKAATVKGKKKSGSNGSGKGNGKGNKKGQA
jgi:subtilisin family serine protease